MNLRRVFTLGAAAGGLAALVTSAATTGNRRVATPLVDSEQTKAAEASGTALAAEVARLRERLHPTVSPRQPARNPFQFHSAPVSRVAGPPTPAAAAAVVGIPAPPLSPSPPPMKLIGIAEDSGANGSVRTAIISGFGELFLVKEGELVTPRYRVARISGDTVELANLDDSTIVRLALK